MSWKRFCKTSWIRFENVLKIPWRILKTSSKRLEDVLKMFWRRFCKTSWRRLENVSWRGLDKTSWRRLEDVLKTFDQDALKISSEDVWLRLIYSSWSRCLKDVLKTSSEDEEERCLQDVLKMSSSRRMFAGSTPNELSQRINGFKKDNGLLQVAPSITAWCWTFC